MEEVEITWFRALKLWWSFAWRGMVLMLLVLFPIEALFFAFVIPHVPKPVPGQPTNVAAIKQTGLIFMIAWPIMMASMVALQAQGMRWMLKKARFSDFRVSLLSGKK